MKNKATFVSITALFALVFALATVSAMSNSAISNCNDWVCVTDVEVNDISYAIDEIDDAVGFTVSETIPIKVKFTAMDDGNPDTRRSVTDVRMRVYIEGFKQDIEDETDRFHVLEGNTYIKKFSLKLPSTMDLDDLTEEKLALLIRVSARGEDNVEIELPLEVQRDLYSLEILSVERNEVVTAGETIAVDVVVANNGFDRMDNVYVQASIPGLKISKKVYVGDLESLRDIFDDDVNDARERRIYLTVPRNAAPGNYEMVVEAYSYDASTKETTRIVVREVETQVVAPVTAKTIAPGEETMFDIVLVNQNDRMIVYTITPQASQGFFVEVTEPVVTVGADSSRTTKVKVKASDNVDEGTYVVVVNAQSEAGVSQHSFTVNVKEKTKINGTTTPTDTVTRPSTVVVLTVILVIIFVVLLIILIVLLSKRPAETEEFGETNYY